MVNELLIGKRRTGEFVDGDKDTPEVAVTLERSKAGISLTIPWSNPDVPYAKWFMRRSSFLIGDDSGEDPRPVPKRVVFHDSYGWVLLIRCRARGYRADAWGPGSGTLWARAAIMGVRELLEFDSPNGLQTEISGLREWLGISSWLETEEWEEGKQTHVVTSIPTETIEVSDEAGISLDFRSGRRVINETGGDRVVLVNLLYCTTRSNDPKPWDEHMRLHTAIRDLLVLSRWRSESCIPVQALRDDDPVRTMDGRIHGEQWRKVVVKDDEPTTPADGYHPHLLTYQDLGTDGIRRWLRLRDDFGRALDPVLSSIDLQPTTASTFLAQAAPGIEALGYLLMIRDGISKKDAKDTQLRARLDRVLDDLADCLPFDGPSWAERTVRTYNALKHANRELPDDVDVMNCWAETVMVVRAWVAVELGTPIDQTRARLAEDQQPRHYVRFD